MNTLKTASAALWIMWSVQSANSQEITIPDVLDITPWEVQVILQDVPISELRFSPELEPIPEYGYSGGRETIYNFSLWWRDIRLAYTQGSNGWNFSRNFDVTQDSIPPEIVIPDDTEVPNFRIYGNISWAFRYDFRRIELAAQIRDGENCDLWWGWGVTEYRFWAIARIDAIWESEGITQDIEWTISATWNDRLYNLFLSGDASCRFPIGQRGRWSLLFDTNLHLEMWNSSAQISAGYQYYFSRQIALWIWADIQYTDYYKDLEVLSNFSDGWSDVHPHVNFQLYNGKTRIFWIFSGDRARINLELEF